MEDTGPRKQDSLSHRTGKLLPQKQWYKIPQPVRRVFEKFPLVVYDAATLPQRAVRQQRRHTLYIFTNPFNSHDDGLSCNPACLKWQIYLKLNDIDFSVAPSSNHASPSGSLPFLIPASSSTDSQTLPLASGRLLTWISKQTMREEEFLNPEQETYMSLIDQSVRNAWLYHLYIDTSNFNSVAHPLYVSASSSNRLVQMSITHQLRQAAKDELLKSMHVIDKQEIYLAADTAFEALSVFLNEDEYFSKNKEPGLFDASIFAYTQLLLEENLPWSDRMLTEILRKYPRLVTHRNHLLATLSRS